jgi:hypothetical protein
MALVLELYGGVLAISTIAFLAIRLGEQSRPESEANRLKGHRSLLNRRKC